MVALLLVGFVPNSNIQWLTMIEARLRRFVHSFFLVADGTLRTIAVLGDARYSPPIWLCEAVENAGKARLLLDLRLGPDQPEYRWARATMIFELLRQRGNEANPLKRGAFGPFEKDFEYIRRAYKSRGASGGETPELWDRPGDGERSATEPAQTRYADADDVAARREELAKIIGQLLRQMYAYINWGIRQEASSEEDVAQILEDIGFTVPVIGKQRSLFDVVFPTTLLVALWSFVWAVLILTTIPWTRTHDPISKILVVALTSATASGCLYGFAIYNALRRRSVKIEERNLGSIVPTMLCLDRACCRACFLVDHCRLDYIFARRREYSVGDRSLEPHSIAGLGNRSRMAIFVFHGSLQAEPPARSLLISLGAMFAALVG